MVAEQPRPPLVGLGAHEAVEVIEPQAARPLLERACQTVFVAWCVVVLAEPGRRVAILLQDFADRRVLPPDDRVIPRIAGRLLSEYTESHAVVVAPGQQRGARGRAERGRVEVRIAQPRLRDPVERRRRDHTAEGARNAVALIVGHHQQDVRSPLRRHHPRRPERRRVLGIEADLAAEPRRCRRQIVPVHARGRIRRSRSARPFPLHPVLRPACHNWLPSNRVPIANGS